MRFHDFQVAGMMFLHAVTTLVFLSFWFMFLTGVFMYKVSYGFFHVVFLYFLACSFMFLLFVVIDKSSSKNLPQN